MPFYCEPRFSVLSLSSPSDEDISQGLWGTDSQSHTLAVTLAHPTESLRTQSHTTPLRHALSDSTHHLLPLLLFSSLHHIPFTSDLSHLSHHSPCSTNTSSHGGLPSPHTITIDFSHHLLLSPSTAHILDPLPTAPLCPSESCRTHIFLTVALLLPLLPLVLSVVSTYIICG